MPTPSCPSPVLREAHPLDDAPSIRALADDTLRLFGDYGDVLVQWMGRSGIITLLAEEAGQAVGLSMMGCFEDPQQRCYYTDLLALAVASGHQRRGIGRALLRRTIEESTRRWDRVPLCELRLSVARANAGARHLFRQEGFTFRSFEPQTYRGGLVALRMSRPYDPRRRNSGHTLAGEHPSR